MPFRCPFALIYTRVLFWTSHPLDTDTSVEGATSGSPKLIVFAGRRERSGGFQSMSPGSDRGTIATIRGMDHKKSGEETEGSWHLPRGRALVSACKTGSRGRSGWEWTTLKIPIIRGRSRGVR